MTTPFGQQPTYADLIQQIADLRDQVEKPIKLDDLPLLDLRSQLIDNGDPLDLSVLALPGQAADFGRAGVNIRTTTGVLTWPGAAVLSNTLTVPHGLPTIPRAVLFGTRSTGPGAFVAFQFGAPDLTNIYVQGIALAGAPGAGVQGTFDWYAAT